MQHTKRESVVLKDSSALVCCMYTQKVLKKYKYIWKRLTLIYIFILLRNNKSRLPLDIVNYVLVELLILILPGLMLYKKPQRTPSRIAEQSTAQHGIRYTHSIHTSRTRAVRVTVTATARNPATHHIRSNLALDLALLDTPLPTPHHLDVYYSPRFIHIMYTPSPVFIYNIYIKWNKNKNLFG